MSDSTMAHRRRVVLVVEDEFLLALTVAEALSDGGFKVLGPAGTVNQALQLIQETRPDAAVLDVTLGNQKVTPVAMLLHSLGVPFVLATASDAFELARHEILADVPNVGKPTDFRMLVELLDQLLGEPDAETASG